MHHQFNIQQLYAVRTPYLCVLYLPEKNCATYSINWLVFITEMKSVYSAVRIGSLNSLPFVCKGLAIFPSTVYSPVILIV
jgi:hypothetical protein